MKRSKSILILFFLFIVDKSSSLDFQITQFQLDYSDNKLHITNNLDNKNYTGKFHIRIEIKRQNGLFIQPGAISGEIGENIKAENNKEILWDLEKDTIRNLNELPGKKAITTGMLSNNNVQSNFLKYLLDNLEKNSEKYLPSEKLFINALRSASGNGNVIPRFGEIINSGDGGGDFIFILKD